MSVGNGSDSGAYTPSNAKSEGVVNLECMNCDRQVRSLLMQDLIETMSIERLGCVQPLRESSEPMHGRERELAKGPVESW